MEDRSVSQKLFLVYKKNANCSITVSSRHILSAAHCVQGKGQQEMPEKDVYVKVGALNLEMNEDSQQKLPVANFHIHPDWDPNSLNYDADLTILHLSMSIIYDRFVKPVCLPSVSEASNEIVGKNGLVAGWGNF